MIYPLLKRYARWAIRIYCTKVVVNRPSVLHEEGPLLLACNHPNSFLDGMILTTLFDAPVFSLARGDAFKKRWTNKLLRKLRLLPVYRNSEGVENLGQNYTTFDACRKTFEEGGVVLIFSEGRCDNEWHLRPLRKGTARLAVTSWEQGIPLKVIPTAINYSSFMRFGKEVHVSFGEALDKEDVLMQRSEGRKFLHFNEQLRTQLHELVYEIGPEDKERRRDLFDIRSRPSLYILMLPAAIGWILHMPLFYMVRLASSKMKFTGHYDSIITSALLISYPIYLLMLFAISFFLFHSLWVSLPLVLLSPVTAWACVQVKYQLDL